jgi:uncharacterized protein
VTLNHATGAASVVGLLVALAGPPLVATASLWFSPARPSAVASMVGQLSLWGLAAAVLAITRFWERLPLSTVGLRAGAWSSIVLGIVGALALLYVATPLGVWLVQQLGLPGFEAGLSKLRELPLAALMFAAVTAGVVEELLYRGYAIERLTSLTGSAGVGALLSLCAFSLAHLPFWGATSALFTFVAGAFLSVLYLWQRNLVSNMLAHTIAAVVQLAAVARSPS